MLRSQLTQNDAVFVIIATASPGTLYLWAISAVALFKGLPQRFQLGIPNKREQVLIIFLSCGSFVLWITSIGLCAGPSNRIQFSQPGCNRDFGGVQWVSLLWSVIFLGRSIILVAILFGISQYLKRQIKRNGTTYPVTP
jgi:hypothetical protein